MAEPAGDILHLLEEAPVPVIPVLVIEDADTAVPIAEALVSGGLRVLEITLRTSAALDAVSRISAAVPAAIVGVGSVIDAAQFAAAAQAGARFAVSPGATERLYAAAAQSRLPWMPGAQSVSDVLELRARGYRLVKFFPAHAAGGTHFLRAIAGPIPDMRFCPTGGISASTAREYLALGNVSCIGGSWLTPPSLVAERQWGEIHALAKQANSMMSELLHPLRYLRA
jgi:2-dehydro-3-deoxyphosphogluconate aldolase / (4S)-4-hydroxy-2-oxoglutarate aldolase